MNVALQPPLRLTIGDVGAMVIGWLSYVIEMPVSLGAKPVPVTVTEFPAAPLAVLVDIFGVTVNVVVGDPELVPVAVMVRGPEPEAGIT